jgi:hypothetical protein
LKSLYFSFQLLCKGYHIDETLASFIKQSTQHRGKEGTKRERGLCQRLSQKSKTQSESQWGEKKEQIMLQSRHIASGGALVIRSQPIPQLSSCSLQLPQVG